MKQAIIELAQGIFCGMLLFTVVVMFMDNL